MSVSEIDDKAITLRPGPAPREDAGIFSWPVFGILAAFLCTFLWCAFLIWLLI